MAKKRINKNLVVGLTLSAFAMMIVLSVLMLLALRRRDPQYFVELARRYEQKEDWQTAALFYNKAWERSRDGAHLVAVGEMLLHDGDVGRALATFRTALVSRPDLTEAHMRRTEVLLELAQLYQKIEDWERLQEAAEAFLGAEAARTPEQAAFAHHANGLALIGLVRRDKDNAARGEQELRTAVELAPDAVGYALDLAAYYAGQNRTEEAEQLYASLIEAHSAPGADAAKVRAAYAEYLAARRGRDEAETYFKQSLALAQGEPAALQEARLAYAVFLSQQWSRAYRDAPEAPATRELFEQAEGILRQCIDAHPDDFDPYLQLRVLYASFGRHADAVDVCEARLRRGFSRTGVQGRRNQFYTFLLMIYASEACVAQAEAARQAGDQDRRDTWLQKAEEYLTDARGERPSHPYVLSQAARIKRARGLDREALNDLRAADEAYKAYDTINWNDKLLLAQLHLKLREAGAAKAVLDEVIDEARRQRGSDIRFWTFYAQVLFYNDELDRALAITDQILGVAPDQAAALRLKAAIYERQGRREEAGRILEALTGDRVVRVLLNAQQLIIEGNTEQGISSLREALSEDPADPRLVGAAVRALLGAKRLDEARTVVEEALAVRPDDLNLKRVSVLVRGDLTAEERDRKTLEIIEAQTDGYQRALELIGFYWRKGDWSKTLELIDTALDHLVARDTPVALSATVEQHRGLLVAKLAVAAALDDRAALDAARDAASAFNVDGAGGKSVVGLYHMYRKEYDRAIRAFREAIEAQPTDARSLTRLGQCMQALRRTEEAKGWFERALRVNPNEGEAHKGLAVIAKQGGDAEAFQTHLEACERLIPTDPWVDAQRVAREEEKDPRAAIAGREKLLANNPDDFENLKRLAVLCEKVNDLPKADRYIARLLELRPDSKELVIAACRYYRRTGRPERSLAVAARYADSRPTDEQRANAQILIASHYLGTGELKLVESTLLSAAELAETFEVAQSLAEFYMRRLDRPEKALPWYDKAVEHARASGSDQLPRVLAARVSCLLDRRLNDIDAAQRRVEELRAEFPDNAQALLLLSEVLGRRGRIDEAVDSLSGYLARRPHDADALYQRALYNRARGRLAPAIEDLKAIKRTDPLALDLQPRLLLSTLYAQSGRKDLRIRELESLVEEAPNAAAPVEELVREYLVEHRAADAERLVTARINRSAGEPDARWLFLRSRVAEEMGNHAKAVADCKRGALISGYSAEGLIRVLDLFLRQKRPAEGIDYYKRHAGSSPATSALVSRYARLLAEADRKKDAVEQFRRAMSLALSESPTARAGVAADLLAVFPPEPPAYESVKEAISLFESVPADEAMSRINSLLLVALYRAAEQFDLATARLEELIETAPDDDGRAELLFALGELHQMAGNAEPARRAYEEGLKYHGDNWIALNNLAYLLSDELGEDELARPYAERAVALSDNPATLDTLGWIYVGLGDYSRAVAELSRAVRLAPEDALTYYHLGEAHRRSGKFDAAKRVLTSGQDLARAAGNTELSARCNESLERVARSDTTP